MLNLYVELQWNMNNIHTALYTLIYNTIFTLYITMNVLWWNLYNICMLLTSILNYSEMYTLYTLNIYIEPNELIIQIEHDEIYILNLYYNWTIMKYTYYTIHWTSRNILYTLYALMKCTYMCLLNLYITLSRNET